jgi:hypothetical protein
VITAPDGATATTPDGEDAVIQTDAFTIDLARV